MSRLVNARDFKSGEIVHRCAKFLQFGLDTIEYENCATSYTVAILELENGNVVTWGVNQIEFINYESQGCGNKDQFYLQDSRDYVGNSMLFWRRGGGYTTDLTQAAVFSKDYALNRHRDRDTDVPWLKEYIDSLAKPVVDTQVADRSLLKGWLGI